MGLAYYNENDPYAAQWLRNLIAAGLIAPGDVDDRSITEVRPDDLRGYSQCHFFAGIAGWSRALRLAGWADDRPVWTGSCPCQPFSVAGKRKGFNDSRHLWPVWFDLIKICRPPVVFGEQVAAASDWLRLVRGDLEALEYAVGAIPMEAASAGADHLRNRYWYVADSDSAAVRDEPGWSGGPDGTGAAIDGDDCQNGNLGLADGDGRQSRERAAAAMGHRSAAVAAGSDCIALAHSEHAGRQRRHEDRRGSGAALPSGEACALGDDPGDGWREGRPEHEVRSGRPAVAGDGGGIEWVIGADGKARRVKSGIRLLAHGVPARVGKLRAFGNAIDPRPAAAFINRGVP